MLASHFRTYLAVLLLMAALTFTGCQHTRSQQTATADTDSILAQSRRLSEAYVRGDIEALVAIYTADGVAAPGGRDFVRGRQALYALWALPEGRTIVRHAATPVELLVDGDHAYDWGYYEGQAAQDGEPRNTFQGAYTIIWERGDDGVWRIAVDMWYGLPAPE